MKGEKMKALILTCNTGQGHNSVAKAINQTIISHGDDALTVDALSFISERTSSFISNWFVKLYRYMPKVFDLGYNLAESYPELFEEGSLIRKFLVSGSDKLYERIAEEGYDCIICPHAFTGLMATHLRATHPELKATTSFVATDYTLVPVTQEIKVDAYFIPDPSLVPSYEKVGIDAGKVYPITGIPVRREFYSKTDKEEAKRLLGIPNGYKHLIMMFGSMGCGPMPKFTSEISKTLPQDTIFTIICGTNDSLKKKLDAAYKNSPQIRIEGFVKDISLIMDSADLYVTKPGGLSTSEARIKKLPMVLFNAVSGCEQTNLEFMIEKGAAIEAKNESQVGELCRSLLCDPDRLKSMSQVFDDHGIAADEIYEILKNLS